VKVLNQTLSYDSQFPKFPADIIQGAAKKFVDLYSSIRETPEAFLWLSFITYLGNAISPYVRLDCIGSEPRFFGVAIGQSGRTRKSAGINTGRDLFKAINNSPEEHLRIVEGIGSAEGLLSLMSETLGPKPVTIHLDEIHVLAEKTDLSGSAGIAVFNSLYENHNYDHPLARKQNYSVRNVYLSVVGASTLEDFTKTWGTKHADAGFFSRLLLVGSDVPTKRIPHPKDPDGRVLNALVEEIRGILEAVKRDPLVLRIDPDADEIWAKFYDTFGYGPEWNRIDTLGFRLMAVHAVLRGEPTVTKANMQSVIAFLQYEVAVRQAVAPVIAENQVARVEEMIRRCLPKSGSLSRRGLQRAINYDRYGIEVFDKAVSNMRRNDEIDEKTGQGKTRYYIWLENGSDDSAVITKDDDSKADSNSNPDSGLTCSPMDCHQASACRVRD
jgi:hypothetical protein